MVFNLKTFDIPVNVTRLANIHYFEFTNQYHTMEDSHSFYEIVYVDKGTIQIYSENYTGRLLNNQLIIHYPDEHHSLECSDAVAPNVIIIGFECSCEYLKTFSHAPVLLTSEQKKMLAEVVKEGMNVYQSPYDIPNLLDMKKKPEYPFGADQMLKLRLEIFLIALVRGNQGLTTPEIVEHANGKTREIHQYICEHYREKITLDHICFLFGMNKTSLCQGFKNEYGMTVLNYINHLKVEEAKQHLRENNLTVTEISELLGFNSVHYFSSLFKKVTKQSPKEYVKTIRSRLDL